MYVYLHFSDTIYKVFEVVQRCPGKSRHKCYRSYQNRVITLPDSDWQKQKL